MDHNARQYMEAQILTATPQKLRLMLIEGAIRYARQTIELWQHKQNEQALETIIRCRDIVTELLSGIRVDESDLTRRVAGIYVCLFRLLVEAQMRRDPRRVEEVIEILESERETWRLVCERLPQAPFPMDRVGYGPAPQMEITAPQTGIGGPAESGFMLDA